MSLSTQQFAVAGFDNNFAYLIYDAESLETVIVDPSGNLEQMYTYISTHALSVTAVYLTHTHHDHYDQLDAVLSKSGTLPIYVYESGIGEIGNYDTILPLTDYQNLTLGNGKIQVLHTPGHSDDAVCFYVASEHATEGTAFVITGDTLFVGGCGRTSAHRVKDLYESLMQLRELPKETIVYPGHDYGETPHVSIEHEVATNKYYQVENFEAFKNIRLS
jgi:hydroxyacylglutathione hydrolase